MSSRTIAIVVEDPSHPDGRRVERFSDLPILVGRSDACHVVIDRPTVSRRHASIIEENGELFVVDENSRTGVCRRDGARITEPTRLLDMAWTLQLGTVTVVVSEETNADTVLAPDRPASVVSHTSGARTENGTVVLFGTTRTGQRARREDICCVTVDSVLANLERDNEALVDALAPFAAAFCTALVGEIGKAPEAIRLELCRAIVERYPMVSAIPQVGATIDRLARTPVAHRATPVSLQALEALSELAKALDATETPLTTVAEVRGFAANVRAVVDELSIGFTAAFDIAARADDGRGLPLALRDRMLSSTHEMRQSLFSARRSTAFQRMTAREARDRMSELVIHLTSEANEADRCAETLGELSPDNIERAAKARGGAFGRWRIWAEYKRRYEEVVPAGAPPAEDVQRPMVSRHVARRPDSSRDVAPSSA